MIQLVSVHGGHSGQFCLHAKDSLEKIVQAYIRQGFAWAGITEHAPPERPELMYEDQYAAGNTIEELHQLFAAYIKECRRLKKKYCKEITLFAAMETESCGNYLDHSQQLIEQFQPEYIVGSVHHVMDNNFDYSPEHYQTAAEKAGGLTRMYARYFDLQYEMIEALKPAVVGHFDLIRIFDPNYMIQLKKPEIWNRIIRNLELIQRHDLILDYNQRALLKGAAEPYISLPILELAKEMNLAVVPGDDCHSADSAGNYIKKSAEFLQEFGFSTVWKKPVFL